ncbi:ribonuclease E/G [Moraxella caviae]|uniref:Ribonuclease E/G n=1 Tax=Moraxella caviae TaxID=34060 RepID=A0A1T0A842_9GAMM|nr:Rne/Rng family ribonuclease [Moraxella caviae]OOR91915.1 ribonuclease E/G [Moraxella caviae]STZ09770.1 Ribonuclease G [Moraxella caviae]VEW13262.1 Ribonuclease G [Moraxella caviae]
MSEEILINHSPMESRVAVLTGGITSEIFIERQQKLGLVGNIYLGTVVRVLPGMQAAFVDIGQSRTAFLHVNDMQKPKKPSDSDDIKPAPTPIAELGMASSGAMVPLPAKKSEIIPAELIQNRLREGEKVLVQVIKDELGTKGARLTTNISLPSRYLVYMPTSDEYVGVSMRIEESEERLRLKRELSAFMQLANLQGGLIARTAAEKVSNAKLEEDIYYLLQLWRMITARTAAARLRPKLKSMLIYQELSLPLRCLRDLVNEKTAKILIDDENVYHEVLDFAREFVPSVAPVITQYSGDVPLFDLYRVEEDLQNALKRRVDLKSGGYLIIDQTEAMTTIDVNTGSFVGLRSLEDTVYKTNLEAAHAIAHQIRLRNLGGIIILDFIDMNEPEHKADVLAMLQEQLALDHAKTSITQVSALGLVEMTRKRTRESLPQQLCEPCPVCDGKGVVKTGETVCFEIFREIMRLARTYAAPKQMTVVASAAVIELLLGSEAGTVADLEYLIGKVLRFEIEPTYHQEQYNIVLD